MQSCTIERYDVGENHILTMLTLASHDRCRTETLYLVVQRDGHINTRLPTVVRALTAQKRM